MPLRNWLFALALFAPAVCLAAAAPVKPPPKPAGKVFPFSMDVRKLPNGLTYIFVPYDSPGLAVYYSLVRTGSRNELEPGRSGFAHFFEHMMFRGTEKYPKEAYDQLLSEAGVANNAFTTDDFTAYHAFGPSAKLPLIVDLESDRFQNLKYSENAFRTEARAVLGEYNKNFSNPTEKMEEVLHDLAFTKHTYKHTTMGFKKDVEGMPELYEYSRQFFERWYTPDNTTLIVVGDFDAAQAEALIKKHYGGWNRKAARLEIPKEPKQTTRRSAHVSWENPTQPRLMMGWHSPESRPDTKFSALQNVLSPYLFGPTSPTYRDLVLDRQLLAMLATLFWDHRDPSLFGAFAILKDEKDFAEVEKTLQAAIAELRSGKVDEKRLADVKSNQKYGVLNSFDTPEAVALQLVFAIGPTGDPNMLEAIFQHMDKLTGKDLVEFARTYLVDTNLTSITLTGAAAKPPPGAKEYQGGGK